MARTKKNKEDKSIDKIDLPELYKYKLLHLDTEMNTIYNLIVNKLKEEYETAFRTRCDAELTGNSEYMKAKKNRVECVNEVLDYAEAILPEGYVVTNINMETQELLVAHNPQRRGKRLVV